METTTGDNPMTTQELISLTTPSQDTVAELRKLYRGEPHLENFQEEYERLAGEAAYDYGMARQAIETIDD